MLWKIFNSSHPIEFTHPGKVSRFCWGNTCSNWQCNNICWIRKGLVCLGSRKDDGFLTKGGKCWEKVNPQESRRGWSTVFPPGCGLGIETLIIKVFVNLYYFGIFELSIKQFLINEKVAMGSWAQLPDKLFATRILVEGKCLPSNLHNIISAKQSKKVCWKRKGETRCFFSKSYDL